MGFSQTQDAVQLTGWRQRQVHELYFGLGLTQEEVAARLRVKQPAVSRCVGRIERCYAVAGQPTPEVLRCARDDARLLTA